MNFHEYLESDSKDEGDQDSFEDNDDLSNVEKDIVNHEDLSSMIKQTKHTSSIKSEIKNFMKHQEPTLNTSYRCIKCHGFPQCLKGAGQENISIRMEYKQELIRESVKIDETLNRAVALVN